MNIKPEDWKELLPAMDEYDRLIRQELEEIDQEIDKWDIKVPKELTEKISKKTGLKLIQKAKQYVISPRTAAVLIGFMIATALVIANPKVTTAFYNLLRELKFVNTEKSIEVSLKELTQTAIQIPERFELSSDYRDRNVKRYRYECMDEYIEVSIYDQNYKLIIDGENNDSFVMIDRKELQGGMSTKNMIFSIVMDVDGTMVEVETNLPYKELMAIVENIKNSKE